MIVITEEKLDTLFTSFKKAKLNIARPSNILFFKENESWKISLFFNSSEYLKRSCYMVLKPLFIFLKEEVYKQTQNQPPIIWEINRES